MYNASKSPKWSCPTSLYRMTPTNVNVNNSVSNRQENATNRQKQQCFNLFDNGVEFRFCTIHGRERTHLHLQHVVRSPSEIQNVAKKNLIYSHRKEIFTQNASFQRMNGYGERGLKPNEKSVAGGVSKHCVRLLHASGGVRQ